LAIRDRLHQIQRGALEAAAEIRPLPDPGTLVQYRDRVGQSFYFSVVGSTEGTVWGTDVYTDDSSLATAAVHGGMLGPGQRGTILVRIVGGGEGYEGSERNGVTSRPYGPWDGGYRLLGVKAEAGERAAGALPDPGRLDGYRQQVGKTFTFEVVGS